jgi:hypothetical protein
VSEIVRARSTDTAPRGLETIRRAAPALLLLGIGVFVYLFQKRLR